MSGIFLSYRRDDSAGYSGRLFDSLRNAFGHERVFHDVSGSVEPGVDFGEAIQGAVGSCEVLIVMIGPGWLGAADADGRRRLDDPDDWIRLEVATALARNIRVVPVLVDGARMPAREELPEDLGELTRRNAIELSATRWDYDVEQLMETLRKVLGEETRRRVLPMRWLGVGAALFLAAVVIWWHLAPRRAPAPPPEPEAIAQPIPEPEPPPPPQQLVAVPNVEGLSERDAKKVLRTSSFKPEPDYEMSMDAADGVVTYQFPREGTHPPGTPVALTVNRYTVSADANNVVTDLLFCVEKSGLDCNREILGDKVSLSAIPLAEDGSDRLIWFRTVSDLDASLRHVLHVWGVDDLQDPGPSGDDCALYKSQKLSQSPSEGVSAEEEAKPETSSRTMPGLENCAIVYMPGAVRTKGFRHWSSRRVTGPGLYSAEVQNRAGERLQAAQGSSRLELLVEADSPPAQGATEEATEPSG